MDCSKITKKSKHTIPEQCLFPFRFQVVVVISGKDTRTDAGSGCVCIVMFSFQTIYTVVFFLQLINNVNSDGVLGCGGFVKSDVDINFSLVEVSEVYVRLVKFEFSRSLEFYLHEITKLNKIFHSYIAVHSSFSPRYFIEIHLQQSRINNQLKSNTMLAQESAVLSIIFVVN